MSESFVSDDELNEFYAKRIEQIALEYHDAVRKFQGIEEEAYITGVEFILNFDIKALVGSKVKTANYGLLGMQSHTTSIGLAIRAAHMVDDLEIDNSLED